MCAAVFLDDEVVGDLEAELDCQILGQGLNGLLAAVEAEAGLLAFKKCSCALYQGELTLLENGKLSLAVGKLTLRHSKLVCACCEVLAACRELCLACRELLLGLCKLLLAGCELRKAVFIGFELSLAVGDHLVDVCREVCYICGNVQTHVGRDGTDNGNKPHLRAVKAGQLCDGAVAELDVLVEIRQQRLDLRELFLAFVISLGVGVDSSLALCELFLACFIGCIALCKSFLACCEGSLACGIVAQTL